MKNSSLDENNFRSCRCGESLRSGYRYGIRDRSARRVTFCYQLSRGEFSLLTPPLKKKISRFAWDSAGSRVFRIRRNATTLQGSRRRCSSPPTATECHGKTVICKTVICGRDIISLGGPVMDVNPDCTGLTSPCKFKLVKDEYAHMLVQYKTGRLENVCWRCGKIEGLSCKDRVKAENNMITAHSGVYIHALDTIRLLPVKTMIVLKTQAATFQNSSYHGGANIIWHTSVVSLTVSNHPAKSLPVVTL